MAKLPTWAIILITTVLLFGGLEVASFLVTAQNDADIEKLRILSHISRFRFLFIGILVVTLEALFWTVAFVELGGKLVKSPLFGAALGIFAYSVVHHWSGGAKAILVSGWIVMVLNVSYVVLRQRSRPLAILSTVAQKIAFIAFAAISIFPFSA
jgi:hypothetical protein